MKAGSLSGAVAAFTIGLISWSTRAAEGTNPPPCVPLPDGLVSWWRGDGNANDSIRRNDGQLQGGATYGIGAIAQGFAFTGGESGVKVPADPSLDVGRGDGLTVEGWINPADLSVRNEIVEWNNGATDQIIAWGIHIQMLSPDEFGLGAGNLFADVHGVDGEPRWLMAPGGTMTTNEFQHVALTYDKSTGMARLFRNGSIVAQEAIGSFTPQTSYDFYLGRRPAGDGVHSMRGVIDEIALYSRALSPAEIQSIYQAGSSGKCPRLALTIEVAEVDVCWLSEVNKNYQLEYRSELTTNLWVSLGLPTAGDGLRKCVTDSVRQQPRRFYRIRELP
jgi:hypothetical protein